MKHLSTSKWNLFREYTVDRIRNERKNADYIYFVVMQRFQESLESTGDEKSNSAA